MSQSSAAARKLTNTATLREKKTVVKQKKSWMKIQEKTQVLMEKSSEKKRVTMFGGGSKKKATADRRTAITAQIDAIRAEQAQRLAEKEKQRKKKESMVSNPSKYIFNIIINPKNGYKQSWDIFIIILVVFSAIYIPYTLALPDGIQVPGILQAIFDFAFLIDFGLCFRTGYVRPDNEIEMDNTKIVQHYLGSWFTIDILASFPLDYILILFNTSGQDKTIKSLLRLLKLPRLLRLGRLLKFLARFKYAGAVKIVKFVFMLVLIAHWSGCFFFFLMQLENEYGHSTWLEHNVGHVQDGTNISGRYLTALYTGFLMLIGEGMDMETDLEIFYGSLMVLLGTIVTAVIVGNVSFVVSNQNSTSFKYQSKIDMITDEMRALHLPSELQDRTLQYYDYLWNRHRTFDPQNIRFTADLSPTLRKEILLHMNRDCVLNCDFFRDVSNDCIIRLVHSFKFAVFLKCDILAEEGEIAESLVFVIHGSAKVIKSGRVMPVSLLSPGDYFGEKSLLMHHRNAVSVVATENCDTRVLEKFDFEQLSIDFPELKDSILKKSDHMDVTEYDRHTRRKTQMKTRREGNASTGMLPGLTAQQQKVLNELGGDINVEEIREFVIEDNNKIGHTGGTGTATREEKRLIEMLSTVSAISTEVDLLCKKADQRESANERMFRKQQQLENQMFELNQNMSRILQIMENKK